jgi:hypothetical protein
MLFTEVVFQLLYASSENSATLYWISASLGCLGMMPYAVANWIMASRYHTISVEMPYVLDDEPIPKKRCTKFCKDSLLIAINLMASLSNEATNSYGIWKGFQEVNWYCLSGHDLFNLVTGISLLTFNFALMYSGFIQIRAVMRIRSYFNDNESPLNMKTLILHAMAFGLYILTLSIQSIVAVVTEDFLCLLPVCETSLWATLVLNFLSQMSLNFILWDLGTKPEDTDRGSEVSLVVEEFDEQAETHARIWNLFAKDRCYSSSDVDSSRVSVISSSTVRLVDKIKKYNTSQLSRLTNN